MCTIRICPPIRCSNPIREKDSCCLKCPPGKLRILKNLILSPFDCLEKYRSIFETKLSMKPRQKNSFSKFEGWDTMKAYSC